METRIVTVTARRLLYAECYKSPDILPRYCAECPVGRMMGKTVTDRELPHATLRIRRLMAEGQAVANRLEEIAFDGVIDPSERSDFADALAFLQKLEESINEIMLIGLENGKAAPVQQGRPKKRRDN